MENLSLKDHSEGDKESTVQGDGGNTQISNPTGGFLKLLPTEGEEMQESERCDSGTLRKLIESERSHSETLRELKESKRVHIDTIYRLKESERIHAERLRDLKNKILEREEMQLDVYRANVLMKTVDVMLTRKGEKLPKEQGNDPSLLSEGYRGALKSISEESLQKDLDLSSKYYNALQRLPKLIEAHITVAHGSEREFAQLLLWGRGSRLGRYEFWSPLFSICFGKSIEEIAKEGREVDFWDR